MAGFWSNKEDGLEIKPEEFQKKIEDGVKAQMTEFHKSMTESLTPIQEYFKAQKEENDRRVEAARIAQEKLDNPDLTQNDFIINPAQATARLLKPVADEQLRLAARMAKQDVLADKEYYTGEIKEKVDQIISQQSLEAQSNPSVILNTYKIVMYDNQDKITKGEIKSKASAATFSSNGTGGHKASESTEDVEKLSKEEIEAAKKFGMTEKEWIAQKKELVYV